MNKVVGHRAALIVALLLVGSLVAPLSLSRVASADDLSVTGTPDSPTTIDATQSVDFTCTPSGGSESGYTFFWDFGDGIGASADQYPSYEYDSIGTWTAMVTVTDDLAATAYWSVDITVNELPSATGTPDSATIDAGQNVDFTCAPSGGTGSYYFYWDFGDGVGTSIEQTPSYTFPSAGLFSVTVTVTDDLGGSSGPQDIGTITVNPSLSVTGSASATAIDVTQTVDFTCDPSDGTPPYTYSWSFGDGGSSTNQYPSYEYDSIGTWTAEVTVTDDVGETGYWSVEIKVYDAHDTIVILSNDDFTYDNGVVSGSGTIDDPYIIENWDIDASGAIGIDIEGTDAYFIVRNCSLHDGYGYGYVGIYLYNCVNGVLTDNTCSYDSVGIYLESSGGITVSNNICSNNGDGIYLYYSDGNTISDNDCDSNNQCGIYLESSSGNTLSNNDCSFNSRYGIMLYSSSDNIIRNNILDSNSNIGIFLQQSSGSNTVSNNTCSNANYGIGLSQSSGNTVSNNTCSFSYFAGMRLSLSSGNILSNNTCSNDCTGIILYRSSNNNALSDNNCSSNDEYGIYLSSSSGNTLNDNTCSNNYDGIYLYYSDSNTLINNTCNWNYGPGGPECGIYLDSSSGNTLSDNNCSDNDHGIYLSSSNSNILSDNNCSSNDYDGIYLASSSSNEMTRNQLCDNALYGIYVDYGSDSNTIWNNTFIGNNGGGVQAYDGGTDNQWYSPGAPHGYGNYWSDWQTPDDVWPGGIVDDPYAIDGAVASDEYPLTTSKSISHAPIFINGNDGFLGLNDTTGISWGSGTADDPYMIEGWDIDASAMHGIRIQNTNVYFIVEECYIHNGGSIYYGIYLYNCVNGILSDNNCSNNCFGIFLRSSTSNKLSNNTCNSNSESGIYLYSSSTSNTLSNNTCNSNSIAGIYLYSNNNNLSRNTCSNDRYGIVVLISSGNSLNNNNCSSSTQYGIYLSSSNSNEMTNNHLYKNSQYGVFINSGSDNRIWNNTFTGNNGAGSSRNPSHLQAYDAGTSNHWNSSGAPHGYGNYWSDWTLPDNNHDGIVDNPYALGGASGASDKYPLMNPPI